MARGCSYDLHKHPDSCNTDKDCAAGLRCYLGFCVSDEGLRTASGSSGTNTKTGSPCDSGADPVECYEAKRAPRASASVAPACAFARQESTRKCLDQVVPTIESCNGIDDDCNDVVDDIAGQSCEVSGAVGGCGVAGAIVCRDGAPSCELTQLMAVESCNGVDDDCDGNTDENIAGACFPADATGCKQESGRAVHVQRRVRDRHAVVHRRMEQCTGATTAGIEECGGSPALDEDCDGLVDENCPCAAGSSQHVLRRPARCDRRRRTGACGAGTQTCKSSTMGPCMSRLAVARRLREPGRGRRLQRRHG